MRIFIQGDNYGGVSVWRERRTGPHTKTSTRWFWLRHQWRF